MNLKKILSLLLSLLMIVTFVPFAAMAEGETTAFDGTISIYYDDQSSDVDKTSTTGNIEISTMFPAGNTASYWVGFSGNSTITSVTYSDSSNTAVSQDITNVSNGRYEIRITGYGTSSYTFTITEDTVIKTAVVTVNANPVNEGNQNNGEGTNPPHSNTVKLLYSVDNGSNWIEYDYNNQESTPNGIEIDATKETGTYNIKFADENNNPVAVSYPRHSMDSDVVGFIGNDPAQPTGFTITSKGINGSGYYTFETSNLGFQIKFTVTGNPENSYTNATVVPVQLGAQPVTVATGLTGELSNASEGFTLSGGTLTFSNTASAGSFDATVGDKLYTVVIFPSTSGMTDLTEDLSIKVNTDDTLIKNYLAGSGFATEEYNFVTFVGGNAMNAASGREGMFGKDVNGAYTPIYVYKTSNGSLVDFDNSYFIQKADAYVGKSSYLIKTEIVKINNVDVLKVYPLTEYAGTTVKKNTMVLGQLTITKNDGSVINQSIKTTDEETELAGTNGHSADVWWTEVGTTETEKTFYIKNGQLLTLFDSVDISTLKVQSTNSTNVKIKEFYAVKGTENAIGFKLSITDTSKFVSELVKVSFKNKKTSANEYFYIPVICRDKEEALSITVTPEQASGLQALYDTFPGTELYLEEGEYATDLYMWRGNLKLIGLDTGAVFTGSSDTSKPILTFGYEGYSNRNSDISSFNNFRFFSNIAIDGKNKTKTGLKVENGVALNLMKTAPTHAMGLDYINNCDIAILSTNEANGSTVNIYGLTFKNNNVAVQVSHSLGYAVVGNHTKEILENNFIGNTTDFKITGENTTISIPQNFYADITGAMKTNGMPTVVGTANVDYMPYYTTADRDTVQARINPIATVAEGVTELEFPVTLMQTDVAVKLDKTLFEQVNAVKDTATYNISVPVREKNDKVYTIWNFDSKTLLATQPEATTLKVTNTLGDGESLYETIDTSKTDVKQVVNFAHSGNLPGTSVVHVLKDDATVDPTGLKLYFLDVENNVIKEADYATVTESEDGKYWIVTIDHCSEYIISTAVVTEETGNEEPGDNTTGGNTDSNTGSSSGSASKPAPTATKAPTKVPATTATPTANDFISAQEVEEKLEAATGNKVVFDVTEKELVSVKAFELLEAAIDKELVFETKEYRWTFKSSDITDANAIEGTTFKPSISLESPNKAAVKALAGDADITNIYFEHHGDLPGKATIEVFVGIDAANLTKYLYHFNMEKSGFEFIDTIVISEKGWATFDITHCSDYILSDVMLDESVVITEETDVTTDPSAEKEESTEQQVTEPVDSDSMGVLPIILVIIVIVVGAVVFFVKKKKAE